MSGDGHDAGGRAMTTPAARVAVLQDGARLHYAVPVALQRAGLLERVYADWYDAPGSPERLITRALARLRPAAARKLAGRHNAELDPSKVVHNPLLFLRLNLARPWSRSSEDLYDFGRRLHRAWLRDRGLGRADALFGFVRNLPPELCADARRRGLRTVGDQMIAPAMIERRESRLQLERWPGWQRSLDLSELDRIDRTERRTWSHLDAITCASHYVRDGLVAAGIDASRVHVMPYPLDPREYPYVDRPAGRTPFTVGFVGGLNLRKGIPYVFDVARRLRSRPVRFVLVGPNHLSDTANSDRPGNVEVVGPVPRSDVPGWLSRFDCLLFPSTCEGSATAVMEAMATGLPVVTSPNSGSVARDGVDGFIRAYDDVGGMAEAVERLADNVEMRELMGRSAARRVLEYNVDSYARFLAELFASLRRC